MPDVLDFHHIPVNDPVNDSKVTCSELPVPFPVAMRPVSDPRGIDQFVQRKLDLPPRGRRHLPNVPQGPPGESDFRHQSD